MFFRGWGGHTIDSYLTDALGYLAAGAVFLTFCMKTMLSLRLIAIGSNVAFVAYAAHAGLMPILVLHGLLLPLNVLRLIELQIQVRRASRVAGLPSEEARFDFLVPMGRKRALPRGSTLFRKGDTATCMFVVAKGEVELPEIGAVLGPGAVLGEIALFAGDKRRTMTAEARTDVVLAEFSETRMRELFVDNPAFAYELIGIIASRLVQNLRRSEENANGVPLPRDPAPQPHGTMVQ